MSLINRVLEVLYKVKVHYTGLLNNKIGETEKGLPPLQNRNGSWHVGFTMSEAHDSTQLWHPFSTSGPSGVMIAPSEPETSCPRQLQLSCTVDTEVLGLVMSPHVVAG